jgi:hypothetical protein
MRACRRASVAVLVATLAATVAPGAAAQGADAAEQTPQAMAPIDLTGYWVSLGGTRCVSCCAKWAFTLSRDKLQRGDSRDGR